jgi:Phosphatidylglycerophosphatase A and related proteins
VLELFRLLENFEIQFIFIPLTFVLFRFFDIAKPWPISKVDRECRGGMGIMLDDLLAGVLTFVLAPVICILLGYL